MNALSTPLQYMETRRERAKRKRTALQMMALSGVIRPSHTEVRYGTSLTRLRTANEHTLPSQPLSAAKPSTSYQPIWQWLRSTSKSILQQAH